MPAPRAPEQVNAPADIPTPGRWPAECTDVRGRDHVVTSADGVPFRGVFVSWVYDDTTTMVSGFRVYLRPKDDEEWWLAGITEDVRTLTIFDPRFETSEDWEVAVVAVSLFCCTWRPPALSTAVAEFRILEREECPPPPTNLRITKVRDRMRLEWDPPVTPGVPTIEVRYGSERVDLNQVLARTTGTSVDLHDLPPADHVSGAPSIFLQVGVLKPNGRLGAIARLDSVTMDWGAAGDVVSSVVGSSSSWGTGTSSDLSENGDGFLELTDQADTSGEFLGTAVDLGSAAERTFLPALFARRTNLILTPNTMPFTPNGSPHGCRYSPYGRAEEAYPREGILRSRGWTPNSFPHTPNTAFAGGEPFSYAMPRTANEPVHTPAEMRWTPNGTAMNSWTPLSGFVSTAGTGAVLQMRYGADGTTWSAWETARPTTRTDRWYQWRVVVTQPAQGYKVEVEDVLVVVRSDEPASADQSVTITKDTEGTTAADTIRFTITSPTGDRRLVTVAVADSSFGDPTASAGLAVGASGVFIGSGNPSAVMQVETDASGEVHVDVTETGAKTRFLRASIEGHPVVELEATWA